MGMFDAVKQKWNDVTGKTLALENEKLVQGWSGVMHDYAEELKRLGDLYGSISGKVQELAPQVEDLNSRVVALVDGQKRLVVALWLAAISTGISLGTLVYVAIH
jgi:phage-related tail protein